MELTSRMKMRRFQTFWIQMRKNKPLDENRKSGQTSWTKMKFYSKNLLIKHVTHNIFPRCYKAKCASCWNPKTMNRFTAKKLTYTTTKNR
ncbi:hypothetical protein Hanom_Chr02g00172951 [Helianthus anomalus]